LHRGAGQPGERRGDLQAQLAGLNRGQERLPGLIERYGLDKLLDMSRALLDYSERAMRELIAAIPDGSYDFTDYLDDDGYGRRDLAIRLTLTIKGDAAALDFRASDDQAAGAQFGARVTLLFQEQDAGSQMRGYLRQAQGGRESAWAGAQDEDVMFAGNGGSHTARQTGKNLSFRDRKSVV